MAGPPPSPQKTGLPNPRSVVFERTFTPKGAGIRPRRLAKLARSYRILRTNEVDPYEAPMSASAVPDFRATAAPFPDQFAGNARKAAKLSFVDAPVEIFADLRGLITTLPSKSHMLAITPEIPISASSDRVAEERRAVRVRGFLYAASREDDRDFHLIIGRARSRRPQLYMTVEISGLPAEASPFFKKLKVARDTYKEFFGEKLPGTSYDFYDPPIPVDVEGSLFFDMSHAGGQGPGPQSLRDKIPTIWELHPVTSILFEP